MATPRPDQPTPPEAPRQRKARPQAMADARIAARAADPAAPRPGGADLARPAAAQTVKRVREKLGLSQTAFAARYRINAARLRDWEQGRARPDSAALAYLLVIDREREAVDRALAGPAL